MSSFHAYTTGFAILIAAGSLSSQRDARLSITAEALSRSVPTAVLGSDGKLEVFPTPAQSWTVDTQIGRTGQVYSWAATFDVPFHYLVSGRLGPTGNGVIQHWKLTNVQLPPTQASSHVAAGKDFVAVTYDRLKQRIYALDAVSQTIDYASWDGTTALPTTGWATLVSSTQVAELATPESVSLGIAFGTGGTYLSIGRYQADLLPQKLLHRQQEILIHDVQLPFSVQRIDPDSWNGDNVSLDALTLAEGSTSVTIRTEASETGSFVVVDLASNTVIGSATAPGNATSVAIPVSPALTIGQSYQVKRSTGVTLASLGKECFARYGTHETTTNNIKIGRSHHSPGAIVGEGIQFYANVYTDNTALASTSGQVNVSGAIALAMRDPDTAIDPVIAVGQNFLIQTSLFVPASAVISSVPGHGFFASESLTLPDDPALIGRVLLHQAFVYDQGWFVSDIVGVKIKAGT